MMSGGKGKVAALALAALGLVGAGAGVPSDPAQAEPKKEPPREARAESPAAEPAKMPVPSAEQLIAYLNDNARRVSALRTPDIELECKQGEQSVAYSAQLICQRPRCFHLKATVLGVPALDIGSNAEECWYWFKEETSVPQLHAFPRKELGKHGWPFPCSTDFFLDVLGIAEHDPPKVAEHDPTKAAKVIVHDTTLDLVEEALSPQGKPLRRVTVFNRETRPVQVPAYRLEDADGKVLVRAAVTEVVVDRQTGAVLPRRITLTWPSEKVEIKLRLYDVKPVSLNAEQAARVFKPPTIKKAPDDR
jgi:hypothetical protein